MILKWVRAAYELPFRVENVNEKVGEIKDDLSNLKDNVVWKDTCEVCRAGICKLLNNIKEGGE